MNTSDGGRAAHPERRRHNHLRAIYDDAVEHVRHLFGTGGDWVGTSIDYAALRLVHEKYPELTPADVRTLVTAIGNRLQRGTGGHGLTALYP